MKFRYLTILIIVFFNTTLFAQISIGEAQFETDYSKPKKYEIAGISVSGVQYLDDNVLIMLSGLQVGDIISIPGEQVSNAIKKLWKQGFFSDVIVSGSVMDDQFIYLLIELKERPRLSKFSFKGIKRSEADNIREEINISRGDIVTDYLLIRTTNKIENYYVKKGYLDSEINIKQRKDTTSSNSVMLEFDIKKNGKVKIYQINIEGNDNLATQSVKKALKNTKEKGQITPLQNLDSLIFVVIKDVLSLHINDILPDIESYINENFKIRVFKSSKYIETDFEEDKIALIDKYNELGYRDAKIVKDSIYKIGENKIDIDIKVDEGKKYFFRNISWVGNTLYTSEQLDVFLKVKKGDVYNKEVLMTNLTYNPSGYDVSSLYLDDGYLFFQVDPVEVLVENDSIDLEIRIYEGKQATINKVTIKGNTRTNDHVVFREIRTRPGALFSRNDLIRTTRELAQLKFFNPEKITPNVDPHPEDGTVDIEYELEETSADQIELSGGWGYGRLMGTVGLMFNNFSLRNVFNGKAWRPIPTGDGQTLSLRLQSYGKGYISYNVSFIEPWFGGKKPNSLSVSYYHSLYSNGLPKSDTNRSSFIINGLSVGLGRRLTWPDDYFTLYQGVSLQRYDLKNYSNIFSFGSGTGYYNNFSYTIAFSRNSISSPIFPRNGSDVSLSLELTPPYSLFSDSDYKTMDANEKYKWIEYYKWKFHANWYIELLDKLVLTPRMKFGFLGDYNKDIGVTPFERFYLGGDGLSGYNNMDGREIIGMRGYQNESITPEYSRDNNVGGTIFTKYTLELRYALSLNPSAAIYVMGFLEAGNDWIGFKQFDPFDVKRSAGVGFRVFLPMFGLLGLDWGYGFDEIPGLPNANGGQFHFSINQSID